MQEFKSFEALGLENLDQQVVNYKSQPAVAYTEDTMFYDMVVGDKTDLGTTSSPKLQLKIMLRQPTKMHGGQYYSFYEPNFFQVFDVKYLCYFLPSSRERDFHAINFDASELGVKHRWPPPWPSRVKLIKKENTKNKVMRRISDWPRAIDRISKRPGSERSRSQFPASKSERSQKQATPKSAWPRAKADDREDMAAKRDGREDISEWPRSEF
ncbi:uncharacterized protein LOC121052556 [Rosa chinensis]|uniref:uncharacterized protein LOC121052556 n=1 Tax=Rosa chinensis TaxID=74649 RepID=UPI001AD92957|nr:uncharacterized protein LOC121052556 [Rosa chinensis]